MKDILAVDRVKKAFAKGQIMDRIEDIRLPFAIIACEAVDMAAEAKSGLGVILKINDGQFLQEHGEHGRRWSVQFLYWQREEGANPAVKLAKKCVKTRLFRINYQYCEKSLFLQSVKLRIH